MARPYTCPGRLIGACALSIRYVECSQTITNDKQTAMGVAIWPNSYE